MQRLFFGDIGEMGSREITHEQKGIRETSQIGANRSGRTFLTLPTALLTVQAVIRWEGKGRSRSTGRCPFFQED
jgi:hypothetical protein